jgi:nuclear pore complex protein Nup133
MTQAIVYGSIPDVRRVSCPVIWSDRFQNPLQFSFPPEVDEESLMQGAEQLSKAVLQSGTISNYSHVVTYRAPQL